MKTYLVTGASTGIGFATALHLSGRGARVFAGVRKESDAQRLADMGMDGLRPVRLDVSKTTDIVSAAKRIENEAGGLDGLVNNAGVVAGGPLEVLPMDVIRQQFEVNVFGLVETTQKFLPLIRRSGGRLVNVGSISGRIAAPFVGAYSASKFAVEAISDALRVELAPWGISVSLIEPGPIATPIWEKSAEQAEDVWRQVPKEAQGLYNRLIQTVRKKMKEREQSASPVNEVVVAIEHALVDPRPRTRYLVGRKARVEGVVGRWIPDRARDFLIRRDLGL